jgi:hypothetical protein
MERLFSALRMVLAPVRGSLYIVVILTSTVFAMATGIVGAAVTGARHHGRADHDQDRLRRQALGGARSPPAARSAS